MLVLNGKKITNILLGTFTFLLLISFIINFNKNDDVYLETVSLPVSGKTVIIDAGHGKPDERG